MSNELEDKEIVIPNPSDSPATDLYPGYIMGAQACLGTFWWILSWFMYIKHNSSSALRVNDLDTITLAW